MKLVFEEIAKKKSRYAISEEAWLPEGLSGRVSDTAANIVVYRRDRSNVALEGNLKGKHKAFCDRCGDGLVFDLQTSFHYIISTDEEENTGLHEVECRDEDVPLLYLKASEPELDIGAILTEQTYLAIPVKILCSENCKGICPGCGVTLNSKKCVCSSENEGSPFAVLKKLINN